MFCNIPLSSWSRLGGSRLVPVVLALDPGEWRRGFSFLTTRPWADCMFRVDDTKCTGYLPHCLFVHPCNPCVVDVMWSEPLPSIVRRYCRLNGEAEKQKVYELRQMSVRVLTCSHILDPADAGTTGVSGCAKLSATAFQRARLKITVFLTALLASEPFFPAQTLPVVGGPESVREFIHGRKG